MDIRTTTKFAEWIRKYGKNLLIALLVMGISYQELRAVTEREQHRLDSKEKDLEVRRVQDEAIRFERVMREKYDEFFRNFKK